LKKNVIKRNVRKGDHEQNHMPQFDVTIAGELHLDLILYGLPAELPPERELLASDMAVSLGGSSAIVAHNLASMGARVGFISKIGNDSMGQIALERMTASGADTSRVRRSADGTATGMSVILGRDTWRNIVTYSGTISRLSFEDLDFDYLTSARHFHLSSFYLQTTLQPRVPELFRRLKTAGLTISIDTNDDPENRWEGGVREVLQYVDIFLPNEGEASRITGKQNLEEAARHLAEIVPLVVIKRGAAGAMARGGGKRFEAAAVSVNPIDAVGAGDSFNAGFISQYIQGADVETCLAYGNLAGALSTTRRGGTDAFLDREHREQFFRDNSALPARSSRS
jgi:sugar/nucleoside kinase (ribokinase family)